MKNDLYDTNNTPTGLCMEHNGNCDCTKWPELEIKPCCWLSCTELCGAACWKANNMMGIKCKNYKEVILMPDLNSFKKWAQAQPGRSVSIELGNPLDEQYIKIWVYDFKLNTGQFVSCVEEIDLENRRRAELIKLVEQAKMILNESA